MRIAFRTDASIEIGTGHVMRCLTLADALAAKGAQCEFICREYPGHLIGHIRSKGFTVHSLAVRRETDNDLAHSLWLGATRAQDVEACAPLLAQLQAAWLVVDHYALDVRWEGMLSSLCAKIMVIDDLADRAHDCDLLLDQNFGSSPMRYTGLVPQTCTQLHGPAYALLNPTYAAQRTSLVRTAGGIRRVLIYFGGGTDPADMTGMALQALSHTALTDIDVDILLGSSYAHRTALEALAKQRGRVTLHTTLPDLAALMGHADLAIGAGGATTWERCCMGLPSILISIAENQRPACVALAAEGMIEYLGDVDSVSVSAIIKAILRLHNDPAQMDFYSHACGSLVDGLGVERVMQHLRRDHAYKLKTDQAV